MRGVEDMLRILLERQGVSEEGIAWFLKNGGNSPAADAMFCGVEFTLPHPLLVENVPENSLDFVNCHNLIMDVPKVKENFAQMGTYSTRWSKRIMRWQDFEALLLRDDYELLTEELRKLDEPSKKQTLVPITCFVAFPGM